MSPDVSCLRVNAKDRSEAGAERVQLGSMTPNEEIVVPHPVGQVMMFHERTTTQPRLPSHVFRLVGYLFRLNYHLFQQFSFAPFQQRNKWQNSTSR